MSFKEVKKINSDMHKSLDVLINEKAKILDNSEDIKYIKNNQLGNSINSFLGSTSVSTQSLQNRTLVEKVNFLLTLVAKIVYISSTTRLISSGTCATARTYVFTPQLDGTVYVSCSNSGVNFKNAAGGSSSNFSSGYISVKSGKSLSFEGGNGYDTKVNIYADIGYTNK